MPSYVKYKNWNVVTMASTAYENASSFFPSCAMTAILMEIRNTLRGVTAVGYGTTRTLDTQERHGFEDG